MDYKSMIPGTFGEMDHIFAGHENDADRAIDLLRECYHSDISLPDLLKEVEAYLKDKSSAENIAEQVDRVRKRFAGWLPE